MNTYSLSVDLMVDPFDDVEPIVIGPCEYLINFVDYDGAWNSHECGVPATTTVTVYGDVKNSCDVHALEA